MDHSWLPTLIAFCGAAGLLTIAPGVDTALVLRTSSTQGARAGVAVTLGIALGCVTWSAAVACGVASLLAASADAYHALKWVGGAYLVWLGLKLITARRPQLEAVESVGPRAGAGTGLLSNLLNPKTGVFYVSFLPQFVPAGAPVMPTILLLGVIHAVMAVVWLSVVAHAAHSCTRLLRNQSFVRAIDRVTGLVLVGLGLRLAFASDRR
jgi:threonine/homoserine/homoserine lactone efflux protein